MSRAMSRMDLDHAAAVEAFAGSRILVVGDVMLDCYDFGTVERVSPEAPIPVLALGRRRSMLGGAGNVLRNLTSLGGAGTVVSVVGDDDPGREIRDLLDACGSEAGAVAVEGGRPTTVKRRFIADGQHLLRVDHEVTTPITAETAARLKAYVSARIAEFDLLILSDYRKGVLTPELTADLIATAASAGKRVVVDPKGRSYEAYRGACLVTPNSRELHDATGLPVGTDEEVEAACAALIAGAGLGGVLATRSEKGMTLALAGEKPIHLRSIAREVADVTGAGDTVVAVLSAGLAAGLDPLQAAYLSNMAAGIVVGKLGAASVRPEELTAKLQESAAVSEATKISQAADLPALLARLRARGLRIGFTNGCFDLLHPGHLSLLQQARAACDYLVVGLNSDASVRRLKGPTRPVQGQDARASVLASLAIVDRVIVFDDDTPESLITLIRPDVLVKGADYRPDQVVGASFVRSYGGRLVLARLEDGFSTTSTVARMALARS
jgi:D-beta-D-heptose 7-phosphate kinase / D-beta-D-heptose 1-phosphate adenosyltransferase